MSTDGGTLGGHTSLPAILVCNLPSAALSWDGIVEGLAPDACPIEVIDDPASRIVRWSPFFDSSGAEIS